MAIITPSTAAAHDNAPEPQVVLHRIYCRDASLEVPHAPQIFNQQKWDPNIDLQVGTEASAIGNDFQQVTLILTVTAKVENEQVAYLAEVKQAGLFVVSGFPDEAQMNAVLGTYCPTVIFPFARETVADLVQRAGFPQLLLAPINFQAAYAQHVAQAQGVVQPATSVN
ncbi:MAG: protein-export chaperone SecB [Nevskiaceae bacterium]|nr:MAG: protein-export chaperone SecB [Nevskiaceae bacterium]TBR73079.1 MAG: protein-export chaperone SecB [Nevskiaceae bacterium]